MTYLSELNTRSALRASLQPQNDVQWRTSERALIAYFRSLRVPVADGGGTQFVEVVTFSGHDDTETTWISLEGLARHLADELSR